MTVRRAQPGEMEALLALRQAVFCDEQGVTLAGDRDGRDGEALQLVAVDGGAVLGTCRVLLEGDTAKFGRLAVRREARGRGIGRALLAEAQRQALREGARRMCLAAQTGALDLYAAEGFVAYGDVYDDEGIPHRDMEKPLVP